MENVLYDAIERCRIFGRQIQANQHNPHLAIQQRKGPNDPTFYVQKYDEGSLRTLRAKKLPGPIKVVRKPSPTWKRGLQSRIIQKITPAVEVTAKLRDHPKITHIQVDLQTGIIKLVFAPDEPPAAFWNFQLNTDAFQSTIRALQHHGYEINKLPDLQEKRKITILHNGQEVGSFSMTTPNGLDMQRRAVQDVGGLMGEETRLQKKSVYSLHVEKEEHTQRLLEAVFGEPMLNQVEKEE